MQRKLTVIALSLLGILALAASAGNNNKLIDDFNDGDAIGWDQNDFTGLGVFDASSGQYVLSTSAPIAVDDPSVGTVETHWIARCPYPDLPAAR